MSNVPIELEKDLDQALKRFPEIGLAVQRFVREQVALQEWRERRNSDPIGKEAVRIVEKAKQRAASEDISHEEAVDRIMAARERILSHLLKREDA